MSNRILVISLLWILFTPNLVLSQIFGRIQGRVTDVDQGHPISGVNILLNGTQRGAHTDENGEFLINSILPGIYSLSVNAFDYDYYTIHSLVVVEQKTDTINIQLFKLGTRQAYEDIQNGKVQIFKDGEVKRILPEEVENALTDKYGFRYHQPGYTIFNRYLGYNKIMRHYLDSLHGIGWEDSIQVKLSRIEQKYLRDHREDPH